MKRSARLKVLKVISSSLIVNREKQGQPTTKDKRQAANELVKIGEASKLLGVSIDTLRRWEKNGWLRTIKTPGGTRLYDKEQLIKLNPNLKRGPKSLLTPISPIFQTTETSHIPPTTPTSQISLSSDKSLLKTIYSISQGELDEQNSEPILSKKTSPMEVLVTPILITVLMLVLFTPLLLLTNYIKNTQTASNLANKYDNTTLVASAGVLKTLADIFTPTFSHRFFGGFQSGSPPGPNLSNQIAQGSKNEPRTGRYGVSGDLKDSKSCGTPGTCGTLGTLPSGQVLAESTPSASFLQINLDTELNGSLAVDGEGFFTGNVTAPNLLYGIQAGTNISITGDAQNPTISTTASSDTLQTVTERGATTTIASTFSGGLSVGGSLNLGQLSSDPSSALNGATYYNTGSNKFRCYVNGSWANCDTDTTGGDGDITGVNVGNGLSGGGSSGSVTLDLDVTTTSTSTTTTANSGLETSSAGLSLLRGCSDSQVLRWDATDVRWECQDAASTAVFTIQESDTTVSDVATILDFLGGDFDLSESPSGEVNIQMAATLTTPTAVSGDWTVGGTTGLTLSGTGGQITFANGETIDNDTDGTISLNPTILALSAATTLTASSLTTATVGAAFTINGSSYVRIGDSSTPGSASSDDDLYVEGQLEVDGNVFFGDAVTDSLTLIGSSSQTYNILHI